ncbi:MAG: hypothetical protein ACP5JH_11175 [Bacteroidota bacterium]
MNQEKRHLHTPWCFQRHFQFGTIGLAILFIAMSVHAQSVLDGHHGDVMRRIEELRKVRIMDALKMNDTTAVKFLNRWNEFHLRMQELMERRNALVDHLQEIINKSSEQDELAPAVEQLLTVDRELAQLRIKFYENLKSILTARQIAEMIVVDRKFNQEVRKIIGEIQRQRMRRHMREKE